MFCMAVWELELLRFNPINWFFWDANSQLLFFMKDLKVCSIRKFSNGLLLQKDFLVQSFSFCKYALSLYVYEHPGIMMASGLSIFLIDCKFIIIYNIQIKSFQRLISRKVEYIEMVITHTEICEIWNATLIRLKHIWS